LLLFGPHQRKAYVGSAKVGRKEYLRDGSDAYAGIGELIGDEFGELFAEAFRYTFIAIRIQVSEYNS